jgi:hypothetical protein
LVRTQAWWFQNSKQSLIQDMTEEFDPKDVENLPELQELLRKPLIVKLEKLVTDFFYLIMTSMSIHFPFLTPLIHKAASLNHAVERNYLARSYDSFTAPGVNYHSVRYSETELFVPSDKAVEAWEAFKDFLVENTVSSFNIPFLQEDPKAGKPKQQRRENNPKFCNINSLSPIRTVAPDTIPLSPMNGETNYVAFSFTLVYRENWADCTAMFQQRLAKFGARPHWGKWFSPMVRNKVDVEKLYGKENVESFVEAVREVDPLGLFRPMLMQNLFFQ